MSIQYILFVDDCLISQYNYNNEIYGGIGMKKEYRSTARTKKMIREAFVALLTACPPLLLFSSLLFWRKEFVEVSTHVFK